MSLKDLIELKEIIKLEFSLGKTRGYSVHELNRLKELLTKYDTGVSYLDEEVKQENDLTSLSKVRNLVMNVA